VAAAAAAKAAAAAAAAAMAVAARARHSVAARLTRRHFTAVRNPKGRPVG